MTRYAVKLVDGAYIRFTGLTTYERCPQYAATTFDTMTEAVLSSLLANVDREYEVILVRNT